MIKLLKGIQNDINWRCVSKSELSSCCPCVTQFSLVHDITLYSPVITLHILVIILSYGLTWGWLRAPSEEEVDSFVLCEDSSHSQHPTNHDPREYYTTRKPTSLELAGGLCCLPNGQESVKLQISPTGLEVLSLRLITFDLSVVNMPGEIKGWSKKMLSKKKWFTRF